MLGEFYFALRQALQGQDELQLLTSPADIVLSPRTLVQPDVFVVRTPGSAGLVRPRAGRAGVSRARHTRAHRSLPGVAYSAIVPCR